MGDKNTELGPGEEAVIPANAEHGARNIGTAPARWYYGYKRAGVD